jgi:hypothetical protein
VTTDVETYERVRAHATRFILVPGHEENALERVVERRAGYTIVEKFERTVARIARSLNPRASAA